MERKENQSGWSTKMVNGDRLCVNQKSLDIRPTGKKKSMYCEMSSMNSLQTPNHEKNNKVRIK